MSNNGLPVTDVVGVSVTLGQRRTAGASAGDAYAEAAQGSAIAAAGSASSAKQAELGATGAAQGINEKAEQVSIDAGRAEQAAQNAENIADANTYYITPEIRMARLLVLLGRQQANLSVSQSKMQLYLSSHLIII